MTTRFLALAALLSLTSHAMIASGQEEGSTQCNCPKCQAARQAASIDSQTLAAQPAGLYSSEATGIFASQNSFSLFGPSLQEVKEQKAYDAQQAAQAQQAYAAQMQAYAAAQAAGYVQQAGHHGGYGPSGPYIRNPGPGFGSHGVTNPAVANYGLGTFPNGSQYDHGHPGRPFDGGRYGYFGGAHRTPGYPHHHHHREYVGPQGPPTAQVAYPYYTTRGPRDFLQDNPPSIGR